MEADEDYEVPRGYGEQLERGKIRGIHETLITASEGIIGPAIVISGSVDSPYIRLWNATARTPSREQIERCALIPKERARDLAACLVYSALIGDSTDRIWVEDSFSFPASQVGGVARAMVGVAEYEGVLPFYAETIIIRNLLWN